MMLFLRFHVQTLTHLSQSNHGTLPILLGAKSCALNMIFKIAVEQILTAAQKRVATSFSSTAHNARRIYLTNANYRLNDSIFLLSG